MLKTYFTTSLRFLKRNKGTTLINTLGLSIGISASIIIYLIVNYHFTFDKFEKEGNRINRVVSLFTFSNVEYPNSGVPPPMNKAGS